MSGRLGSEREPLLSSNPPPPAPDGGGGGFVNSTLHRLSQVSGGGGGGNHHHHGRSADDDDRGAAARPNSRFARLAQANSARLVHGVDDVPHLPAQPVPDTHPTSLHRAKLHEAQLHAQTSPNWLARVRYVWREELAEALGTFMIILFGTGVEAQVALHWSNAGHDASFGNYLSARFAWAAGVAIAVWSSGGISGGHCNPCVTLALTLFRGFPRAKALWYVAAQVAGATVGALVIYANYWHSIDRYEGGERTVVGPHATAGIFFTFPQAFLPWTSAALSEIIATGALVAIVFALSDPNGIPPPKGTLPFAMFLVLIGIGSSLGVNTGYGLNGARDTGPRIALWLVGYGKEVWTHDHYYWFWSQWISAPLGGVLGALTYDVLIYSGVDSPVNRPVVKPPQDHGAAVAQDEEAIATEA